MRRVDLGHRMVVAWGSVLLAAGGLLRPEGESLRAALPTATAVAAASAGFVAVVPMVPKDGAAVLSRAYRIVCIDLDGTVTGGGPVSLRSPVCLMSIGDAMTVYHPRGLAVTVKVV